MTGSARHSATLRVWVDAQLPPSLARWLREAHAINASHVAEHGLLGGADRTIFETARAQGVTAVMTKDEDFVQILERHGPPPQVVWVTVGNIRNRALQQVILDAWPRVAELLQAGEPLVEIGRRS